MADARSILLNLIGKETVSPAAKKAADAVDDLGDELRDTATDADRLDRKIEEVERSLRGLAEQAARNPDDAGVFKSIRAQERELRKLTKVKGLLGDAAKAGAEIGETMAKGASKSLSSGLSGAFQAMPPQVQAAVVAAGVAIGISMSAAIGAALTAGILMAVGGGVLVAGIVAAAKSPAVEKAFKGLGDRAKAAFADFGKPFEGPLIRAAETFAGALERMAPTLKAMGQTMAPLVDRLAPAFASMAEKALPGIQAAVEASVPLFEKLAEHAPKLGESISRFFDAIAEGGPGAALFFERLLEVMEVFLPVIGEIIGALANLFIKVDAGVQQAAGAFRGFLRTVLGTFGEMINGAAKAFGWMPGIGGKLKSAADEFNRFRDRVNRALDGIKDETVNVTVYYRERGRAVRIPNTIDSGIGGRAAGGPVRRGQPYLVGEEGPELLVPDANGRIIKASDTRHLLAASRGSSPNDPAPSPIHVEVEARWVGGGGPLGDLGAALTRFIQLDVVARGGGDVQTAYGRRVTR